MITNRYKLAEDGHKYSEIDLAPAFVRRGAQPMLQLVMRRTERAGNPHPFEAFTKL